LNKIGKIILAIVLIAIVSLLVFGTQILKKNIQITDANQDTYLARKEDLAMQEQKLEILIEQLNVTLEQQKKKQEILISQLSDSEKQKLLAEKAAADAAAKAAVKPAPVAPTPAPKPVRKTRAS
jgi:uncharacterized membrane protein YhiD involved in acid resistance